MKSLLSLLESNNQNNKKLKSDVVTKNTVINEDKCIIFQGHEGYANSIKHYYHFFFGAFLPLLEYHINIKNNNNVVYRIKSDVGPMKSLLCDLLINIIEFVGPELSKTRNDAQILKDHIALPAYDVYEHVLFTGNMPTISPISRIKILEFFEQTMPEYIKLIPTYDIILIERSNQEKYYENTELNENNKLSGSSLRSIRNHSELLRSIESIYGSDKFQNVKLERANIYYQFRIFSNAKVVIGQHGAALSNIFFMKRADAGVIEILPPADHIQSEYFKSTPRRHFINLAKSLSIRHELVLQSKDHSDIDPTIILDYLSKFNLV